MNHMHRKVTVSVMAFLFAGSLMLTGCSSSPDEAQLKQMKDLKDEVSSLQSSIAAKEQEKANLDKEVADKNAKLKKCNDDQQIVKQRLGSK